MTLDYASPSQQRPPKWPRTLIRIVVKVAFLGLLVFALISLAVWWKIRDGDKLTVTLVNKTAHRIEDAAVMDGPTLKSSLILQLGSIEPGQSVSKTIHFGRDYGPSVFRAMQSDSEIGCPVGCLLTDDGPFDYTVVIHSTGIHIDAFEADEGSSTHEFPLIPSTHGQ